MKKFVTVVLCLGLLFSVSKGYSALPSSQEDNKSGWWNINIPKIEITDGMWWAGLGIATYAAYRLIATGFGGLGTLLASGIGHCGNGVLGIGNGLAAHPYIFISAGIIVGGIAALDYYSDAAMFNKMKSSWKYLWGASN